MNLSREVKTAILILGCLGTFIFGFSYLKGTSIFDNDKVLYAAYEDVEGLVVGAKVTINGFSVGKVKNIDFDENYQNILVSFNVRNDLSFSNQSVAQLYEAGLIGGKAIAIIPQYDSATAIKDGDILPSEIKPGLTELVNQQIAPLQDKIEGLLTSADSLFAGVSNVLNYESQNNLKLALNGLTESISNINNLSKSMSRIVNANEKVFNSTMGHVESTSKNLSQLTDSLSKIEFGVTMKNMEVASEQLKSILSNLEEGNGSAGKLLNDDALYTELLHSSEALEALLTDLKDHPKKYVHFSLFGRKDKSNEKK
ncbi:MAG: MlaD family protein [Flavobacteriaceae bacterium]|nr:MlaD family protein [Flavobacteriaceae bacterium]MDG1911877.1 MlaD family protein [Flavobacteriaceae bacterium]